MIPEIYSFDAAWVQRILTRTVQYIQYSNITLLTKKEKKKEDSRSIQ